MPITDALKARPEFQAFVRHLEIEGKDTALKTIEAGRLPRYYARPCRLFMTEQIYLFFQLSK